MNNRNMRITDFNLQRFILVVFMSFIIMCVTYSKVCATEETEWDVFSQQCKFEVVDAQKHTEEIIKCNEKDITYKEDVEAFAISESCIAVVFIESSFNTLGIFDKDMNLIKSFELNGSYKNLGIIFHGGNIVIVPSSQEYATEVTAKGEFVCLYKLSNQEFAQICEISQNDTRSYNGETYYMTNKKGKVSKFVRLSSAAYLMRTDALGSEVVLYDSSDEHRGRTIGYILIVILILIVLVPLLYYTLVTSSKYKQ